MAAHMMFHEKDRAQNCNNCYYQTNGTNNIRKHTKNTENTATIRQYNCEDETGVRFVN